MTTIILLPVEQPVVPCTDRTSPTFWTETSAGNASWNGSAWDLFQNAQAPHTWTVAGVWNLGYRPTSVDFTYTNTGAPLLDTWDFIIRDTSGAAIGSVTGVANGNGTFTVNVPLTFTTFDIGGSPAMEVNSFAYNTATLDSVCFNP